MLLYVRCGLLMSHSVPDASLKESDDNKTYFLKIHAPWEVLAKYAEVLKIKVRFKEADIPKTRETPLGWIMRPFRLPDDIMKPDPDYYTAPFNENKVDFFHIENRETFFPPSTRNRIVSCYSVHASVSFSVSSVSFVYRFFSCFNAFRFTTFSRAVRITSRIISTRRRPGSNDS